MIAAEVSHQGCFLNLFDEVRGDDEGDVLLAREEDEVLPDVLSQHWVQSYRRFIEYQKGGLVDQGHRQRYPSLLTTAGKRTRAYGLCVL